MITNDILQFAPFVQGVFTNEAARDAAITSPTEGMHAYITASTVAAATGTTTAVPTGVQTIYNGTNWVCVTPVAARSETAATTTTTPYVTTLTGDATAISVTLVTGTTAKIELFATVGNSTLGAVNHLAFSVSGATTVAANQNTGAYANEPVAAYALGLGRTIVLTGLTAGTNTFTLSYGTSAGTLTYVSRTLTVQGIA